MTINWNNLFKIRLSNITDSSMHKHDIVKLLLVRKLLEKHKKEKTYIRIYTELALENKRICDVYYENQKQNAVYIYEIQKDANEKWLEKTLQDFKNFNVSTAKTTDLIIIKLQELGDTIQELNLQLDKYLY